MKPRRRDPDGWYGDDRTPDPGPPCLYCQHPLLRMDDIREARQPNGQAWVTSADTTCAASPTGLHEPELTPSERVREHRMAD